MNEFSTRLTGRGDAFGREEPCEVEYRTEDGDGKLIELTRTTTPAPATGCRSTAGQGEEVPGYLICAKHAAVWRETYRDRGPYTIRSWDGFGA